jgi:hypothetical protein
MIDLNKLRERELVNSNRHELFFVLSKPNIPDFGYEGIQEYYRVNSVSRISYADKDYILTGDTNYWVGIVLNKRAEQ